MTEEKRGSRGGNARKEKLSPEKRKEIARLAAQKRWAKKDVPIGEVKELPTDTVITGINVVNEGTSTVDAESAPDSSEPKHSPSCIAGERLEEGEKTQILSTVEHTVTLPAAFADAESVVSVPERPANPQKPVKRQARSMPKEFKTASSYAERRLPVAIKEKSDHVGAVARLDAEINDLVRVIKALGGTVDPQAVQPHGYQTYQPVSYAPQVPSLPSPYPEYQPPIPGQLPMNATPPTTVTVPKPMKMGGAGALDFSGIIDD